MQKEFSRRQLLLAAGAGMAATGSSSAQDGALTARQIVERIRKNVGIPWREQTVDNFKDGSNPDAPLTGIATTMVATFELLHRAVAAKRNLIVVHEPIYYSNTDDPKDIVNDPMFRLKRDFVASNNLSVFRFHDHWHGHRPDGIIEGMAVGLGWKKYQNPDNARLFQLPETTLNALALQIRDQLKIRAVRVVGDPQTRVSRAAFNPGSTPVNIAMRYFSGPDVDVLVCGEPGEWNTVEYVRDSIAAGKKKGMIILGHDMSEERGMEECARWLKGFVTEVPVEFMPAGEAFWPPVAS
ncbi:MAG TPA: Nif3-like dinuclear metal center hexameric protein [Verrucomicrobiae bacterium]|nr:Nif3-like dinuclear metal center hexameric protein [Verrucomicrobiae bacterium]